jgi:CheY-like chemotaxis protein
MHYIFLVDDDPDDRTNLKEALEMAGSDYEIIEAHDGENALEQLKGMKAKGNLPSLIVLDINMPKINGKQLVVAVQSDEGLSSVPMVVFSTSSSALDKMFFSKKNVELIEKPFELRTLVEVAGKLLSYCKDQN